MNTQIRIHKVFLTGRRFYVHIIIQGVFKHLVNNDT
jgi:hypothetical protein